MPGTLCPLSQTGPTPGTLPATQVEMSGRLAVWGSTNRSCDVDPVGRAGNGLERQFYNTVIWFTVLYGAQHWPAHLCWQMEFSPGHKTDHIPAEQHVLISWAKWGELLSLFSSLQVCSWWVGPSSTQWWVQPGWREHTPTATPTSWRGWPFLWRWSADSSMSSWGSENEPLLHPSVPSNPTASVISPSLKNKFSCLSTYGQWSHKAYRPRSL